MLTWGSKLRTKDEHLQGYYIHATESGRTIVWFGVDPETRLKHHCKLEHLG